MQYHDDCKCCGHRVTAYTANLNRPLARAFVAFCDARTRFGRPVLKNELALTHGQYGNFQKLAYWKLIFMTDAGWEWTSLGINFFLGNVSVLTPAGHMGNEALPDDHLAWSTHKGKRVAVTLRGVLGEEWDQRPKYADEKRDQVA